VDAHQLLTSGENLHIPMTLDDPIYVIFTSGSTGKPKGAINQHRGIVNRFFNMNDRYQCGPEDTILLTSHHIFDSSVWQIFWPLINGARTVIPLPTQGFDFTLIVDLIDQESVTIADFVPSVFQLLLDYITNITNAHHILRSLRQLIIGGEAMQAAPIWQFMSMFPGVGISNAYGPTETSIGVIFFEVYEKCPDPIPIGRPLHNVYTVILDSHLHPVPIGIAGDLYVGGVCVGLGYLKNQEATDLVFITNPFPEISSKKLYKTGDKAKFLPDGNIQFLGRTDHQVKIRGIRIELGEIERALAEHPDVKDCVVLAQQDQQGDKYLIAYVVPRQQATLTPHDLSHFLKKKLPSSMVPSSYMLLEAFPLTAGGKLHLQALPIPDQSHRVQSATYVPPRTPLEELIGEIWRGLLKIDRISVHENFFELGGHSLLATQVLSRVRTLTHTEVSLRTLFDCPTIAQLANSLEGLRSQNEDEQTPPLRPQNHAGPIPLSFAQERLWFLAQLDPESTAYLMSSSFHLRGALRIPILEASLQLLVQRHAALRTTFKLEQDVPVQIISPEVTVSLSLLDLQSFAATEQSQEVDRILHEEAHLPFDLTIGPLFRFRVFNLAAENHIFLVTLHHIISDGWSMGVFLRELTTAYAALVAKELPSLPELPIQYADYAVWQRDYLQGTELEGQLAYWREQLQAPLTPLALPTDYPRPALQTSRGGNLTRHLAPEILQSLKTFCQAESVTMFMTLLAVLQALLARHSGQEDIVVGTPVAHRNRLELEGIVGLFLNTLVLRTDLSGMPTFRQLLSRVREVCLGAYSHQELPFEKL
ncbi:MAG: non-ribosomal peptide synthetase, partial [Nitrospirales bacterium]